MVKLNVIVLGYYGKLNAGDDILMQAICFLFKEHNLMFSSWFPGLSMLNNCDLIVVGGGSIWPGNTFFELGDNLIKKLKTPYMVIGISTKRADDHVLNNNQNLMAQAQLFLVRDQASKNILKHHNSVATATDLFWTMPFEVERKVNEARFSIGFNLRMWENTVSDYAQIVSTVKSHGDIIPFPMYFGSHIHESSASLSDVELLKALKLDDVPKSFSIRALENCHIMVAMRFHAILLAIRSGIPTIGFDYHPKVKALFEENDLAEFCISLNDDSALDSCIDAIKNDYFKIAEKFKKVAERLAGEGEEMRFLILDKLSKISKKNISFPQRVRKKLISFLDY